MKTIDITFPTPQQNLACDEALIDLCEEGFDHEILRFWEPLEYFVVLGYSNKIESEINELSCKAHDLPVLRRCSGGGTVLQGPGCLNFSLILDTEKSALLKSITKTNAFIMENHKKTLGQMTEKRVEIQGVTDLTLDGLKFSGNAQRRKRRFLLFHGTFLCNFDIDLMEKFLAIPPKQPAYRRNRQHRDFVTNLKVPTRRVMEILKKSWNAEGDLEGAPLEKIEELVKEKYSKDEWNFKF